MGEEGGRGVEGGREGEERDGRRKEGRRRRREKRQPLAKGTL